MVRHCQWALTEKQTLGGSGSVPSGLLQRLQRRVALEALGESGSSLGAEAVASQTASRGVWLVVRSVNGRWHESEH